MQRNPPPLSNRRRFLRDAAGGLATVVAGGAFQAAYPAEAASSAEPLVEKGGSGHDARLD